MTFDTCIKVCVLTTQIKMYNISVTPKSFLMPHSKIPFPHPWLLAILNLSAQPLTRLQ